MVSIKELKEFERVNWQMMRKKVEDVKVEHPILYAQWLDMVRDRQEQVRAGKIRLYLNG